MDYIIMDCYINYFMRFCPYTKYGDFYLIPMSSLSKSEVS